MKRRVPLHNNWATPKDFYDKLNERYHFDFDPCPLNAEFNGLEMEWGRSNFINPPYDRKGKELFIKKAFEESKKGKLCVMLLPVSTSTKIFHEVILPNAKIEFIKGRLKFNGSKTSGMHDSMIVIFNSQTIGEQRDGLERILQRKSIKINEKETARIFRFDARRQVC